MNNKTAMVSLLGEEYPLVLNFKTTKAINEKYGTLQNCLDVLGSSDEGAQIDIITFLIMHMVNEGVNAQKISTGKAGRTFTQDEILTLLSPHDLQKALIAVINSVVNSENAIQFNKKKKWGLWNY